jgi:Ca2+-binding EF-hand superfamily protein
VGWGTLNTEHLISLETPFRQLAFKGDHRSPHFRSIMKRRRTLFAVMAFCALERRSGATPSAMNTVPLQCRITPKSCKHQGHQRVAFLFSMLKRRTQRLKDAQLEDRSQPLPKQSHLIDYKPSSNGFNGKTKTIDVPKMYFASPAGASGVNGDTAGEIFASRDMKLDAAIKGDSKNGARVYSTDGVTVALSDISSSPATDAATNEDTNSTQNKTSFKASLLTGLEVQTAAHRTRLLSDLLEGVKEGVMNAVDTEKEKIWFNEEKSRFWQFWKRGSNASPEADSEGSREAAPDQSTPADLRTLKHSADETDNIHSSKFASRTITGLINALAQEVENLEVKVDSDPTTPLSNKTIHSIQIYFSRLGFQQLKMGDRSNSDSSSAGDRMAEVERITADEAFDRIDVDQSGGLDAEELASALKMAALMGGSNGGSYIGIRSKEKLSEIASRLIKLYDTNGDGFVDREEYAVMVRDMAFLREKRLAQDVDTTKQETEQNEGSGKKGWFGFLNREENGITTVLDGDGIPTNETAVRREVVDVTENEVFWSLVDQGEGSIVLEDLNLDLRRLVFGAIPVFKRVRITDELICNVGQCLTIAFCISALQVLPGGHLILKPFTATVTGE